MCFTDHPYVVILCYFSGHEGVIHGVQYISAYNRPVRDSDIESDSEASDDEDGIPGAPCCKSELLLHLF